jgi:hypothetical protein
MKSPTMPLHLYKVSPPRTDLTFHTSRFWHTADWESSSDRPREGYVEDSVLFAGDFDEVNIHLFPRVRTVRVRAVDAEATQLEGLGLRCRDGVTAHVFVSRARKREVEAFQPTIFKFESAGFARVRKGEYVCREPRTAISSETISMHEALVRWNIEACYVEDLDHVIRTLSREGIYFDEQT